MKDMQMEWSSGVAEAIATAKAHKSPLLVLVEPPMVVQKPTGNTTETAVNLYARLATRALYDRLFVTPSIIDLVTRARMLCLRFPAEVSNADFVSFSAFFQLKLPTPNLFLIAPDTGLVLYRMQGYVSPTAFQKAVCHAVRTTSGSDIKPSEVTPAPVPMPLPACESAEPSPTPTPMPGPAPTPTATPARSAPSEPVHAPRATTASPPPLDAKLPSKSLKLPRAGETQAEARLRARLPDGRQLERVYAATALFSSVRTWICEAAGNPAANLVVSTTFPRYVFSAADDAKQLCELDLLPSASLVVAAAGGLDGGVGATGASGRVSSLATGIFSVFRGFFNSFVTPPPADAAAVPGEAHTQDAQTRGSPAALRMTQARPREDGRGEDGHWVSNGNSTQFGWRPDGDEEQR